eukprot:scaffold795_cov187-Amphora_coffeaeformis.AAC.11
MTCVLSCGSSSSSSSSSTRSSSVRIMFLRRVQDGRRKEGTPDQVGDPPGPGSPRHDEFPTRPSRPQILIDGVHTRHGRGVLLCQFLIVRRLCGPIHGGGEIGGPHVVRRTFGHHAHGGKGERIVV